MCPLDTKNFVMKIGFASYFMLYSRITQCFCKIQNLVFRKFGNINIYIYFKKIFLSIFCEISRIVSPPNPSVYRPNGTRPPNKWKGPGANFLSGIGSNKSSNPTPRPANPLHSSWRGVRGGGGGGGMGQKTQKSWPILEMNNCVWKVN